MTHSCIDDASCSICAQARAVHSCPATERVEELKSKLKIAERVIKAAQNVGMNWKNGAPYGMDDLQAAVDEWELNQ